LLNGPNARLSNCSIPACSFGSGIYSTCNGCRLLLVTKLNQRDGRSRRSKCLAWTLNSLHIWNRGPISRGAQEANLESHGNNLHIYFRDHNASMTSLISWSWLKPSRFTARS